MKKLGLFTSIYFSLVSLLVFLLILFFGGSDQYNYISNEIGFTTEFFEYSIKILNYFGKFMGGYMLTNILLFVIIFPGIILYFFILSFLMFKRFKLPNSMIRGTMIFSFIYFLIVFGIMYFFCADPVTNIPYRNYAESNFFNICCNLVFDLSRISGISYEALNISVFVVLQPSLIFYFMFTSSFFYFDSRI
jgi:hypothetical protein